MKDRRDLQAELNRINELYQEKDLEMRKIGGNTEQRQQMRDMMNAKKEKLVAEMGDDLQQLNAGKTMKIANATPSPFGGLKKKLLGAIPMAGAMYGLASGDPAMAAEEAAGDIPVAGQIYEAIKPTESGNPEEEKMILAERQAMENYKNSPAGAARRAALQGMK
jgi:hypothetical protein